MKIVIVDEFVDFQVNLWYALEYKCINPAELTEDQWQHLYELESKHQRKRLCRHLLIKKEAKLEKKKLREEKREANIGITDKIRAERGANPHIIYGLGHNALLCRIRNQTINKWLNSK